MSDKKENIQERGNAAPLEKDAVLEEDVCQSASRASGATASAGVSKKKVAGIFLLITILYVSVNLRAPLIGVGPVIDSIRAGLGLSGTELGVLFTMPVLCFGVFAPIAPRLLRLQSPELLVFISLIVLTLGIALRSVFGSFGLFTGTFFLGLAISVVMVVLPGLIKRHFPANAGTMMGLYSTALSGGAAMAAGLAVPLEQWFGGWEYSLGIWAIPALVAVLIWVPQLKTQTNLDMPRAGTGPRLYRSWLAWQVTLYMGFQGAVAYCIFGWLPLILIERGLSAEEAGYLLAALMTIQLTTAISGPWLATRGRDQRLMIFIFMMLVLVGLFGMFLGPIKVIYVWSTVFGLGFGGMFSVAMALLVLRSPTPQVAASLSGMAQGVGYFIAALAPLMVGVLHEYTGDWTAVLAFMVLLIFGTLWTGLLAGRARLIE